MVFSSGEVQEVSDDIIPLVIIINILGFIALPVAIIIILNTTGFVVSSVFLDNTGNKPQ